MTETAVEKDVVLSRISEIVDSIQSQSTSQELDKHEMVQLLLTLLLKNWSLEQVMAIPDDELMSMIESIMLFELTAGMLSDLTSEEMEIFDAAVAGR